MKIWKRYSQILTPHVSPIASFHWHPIFLVASFLFGFLSMGSKGIGEVLSVGYSFWYSFSANEFSENWKISSDSVSIHTNKEPDKSVGSLSGCFPCINWI